MSEFCIIFHLLWLYESIEQTMNFIRTSDNNGLLYEQIINVDFKFINTYYIMHMLCLSLKIVIIASFFSQNCYQCWAIGFSSTFRLLLTFYLFFFLSFFGFDYFYVVVFIFVIFATKFTWNNLFFLEVSTNNIYDVHKWVFVMLKCWNENINQNE